MARELRLVLWVVPTKFEVTSTKLWGLGVTGRLGARVLGCRTRVGRA